MQLEEPGSTGVRLGPLWLLLACLAVITFNLYLLLSLNLWWGVVAGIETLLALTLGGISLVRASRQRWPTLLQVLFWSSLATAWLLYPLRARVIDHKVEQAGTDRLLQDARALAAEVTTSEENSEDLDPANLLVPSSFRSLNPILVRVRTGSVALVYDIGISSFEAIIIDTATDVVPGPVGHAEETHSKEADWDTTRRVIAPGIEWYSSST